MTDLVGGVAPRLRTAGGFKPDLGHGRGFASGPLSSIRGAPRPSHRRPTPRGSSFAPELDRELRATPGCCLPPPRGAPRRSRAARLGAPFPGRRRPSPRGLCLGAGKGSRPLRLRKERQRGCFTCYPQCHVNDPDSLLSTNQNKDTKDTQIVCFSSANHRANCYSDF